MLEDPVDKLLRMSRGEKWTIIIVLIVAIAQALSFLIPYFFFHAR